MRLFKLKMELEDKQYKPETSPKVTGKHTNQALNNLVLAGIILIKIMSIFRCELEERSHET